MKKMIYTNNFMWSLICEIIGREKEAQRILKSNRIIEDSDNACDIWTKYY